MTSVTRKTKLQKLLDDQGKLEEWREAGVDIQKAIPGGRYPSDQVTNPNTTAPKAKDRRHA